jgi:hypothetical protein
MCISEQTLQAHGKFEWRIIITIIIELRLTDGECTCAGGGGGGAAATFAITAAAAAAAAAAVVAYIRGVCVSVCVSVSVSVVVVVGFIAVVPSSRITHKEVEEHVWWKRSDRR